MSIQAPRKAAGLLHGSPPSLPQVPPLDPRGHEFLFLQTAFNDARVLSALIPVGQEEPERLVGAHHTVAEPR